MLSHGSSGFHPRTLIRPFLLHANVRPHFRRRPLRFHLNPKTRNSSNTSYFPYLSSTLHLRYMLSYPTANPVGPDSDARTSTRSNLSPVTLADRPYCNTPTSVPTYLVRISYPTPFSLRPQLRSTLTLSSSNLPARSLLPATLIMPLRAVLCLRGASYPHTLSPPTRTSINPHPIVSECFPRHLPSALPVVCTLCRPMPP